MKTIGIDISVLVNEKRTGVGVYTYELVKALLEVNKEDKFVLFALSPFKAYRNLLNLGFDKYPNVELKIYKIPARIFRNVFLLWQKLNWPNIEDLTGKIDIFHSFNWYLPPVSNAKLVATLFDITPVMFPEWHQEITVQLDKIRLERISKLSDLVITISESSKRDYLSLYNHPNIQIVYPGVSEMYKTKHKREDINRVLKEYNISKGYYLSVATLEPRKNLSTLIQAYIKGKFERPLVLVGSEGWKNEKLIDLAQKYKNKIIFTGYIPDIELPILYSQALCLIYPSFYEGFGLPVVEAMSSSTPVICSNTSSLPEAGGDAAYYIDPNDWKNISDAISKVTNNSKLRHTMIKRGLEQSQKFSWRNSANKLNKLYQKL